jgi:uroporphyrinogen-III synthase
MDLPLKGIKVLITRPEAQTHALSQKLNLLGADVLVFPVIEIVVISPEFWPTITITKQDMLVFVSRNAVTSFIAGFKGTLPENTQCVAVGAATAQCLTQAGFTVDIQAPPPAGSDSLLTLSEMQNVANKQVMIVRGEAGRELLADTLIARGATISYLEVYRRCMPSYDVKRVAEALTADWLVVTSVTGLENLCQMMNNEAIKFKMLLVVSTRIEQVAVGLGFQHIVVSKDVCDAAVVNRIVEIGQENGK